MRSLITLLILTSTLFSKIDTTQNYFPLAVDNVWQYMYDDGRLYQERITKDSIDSFGYTYYLITSSDNYSMWKFRSNLS